MTYKKIDYSKEKPTVSGRYFTFNEIKTIDGSKIEKQVTFFDLENDKIWNVYPIKYWLKPIEKF